MADYDSDSSAGGDDIETNVLLGYAARDPTGDDFSQIGGLPTWFDTDSAPSGAYAKCKVCNGTTNLLLQLNADLPDKFPSHERRLYIFGCKRKACRRKDGCIRALRAIRITKEEAPPPAVKDTKQVGNGANAVAAKPKANIGEALFGVKAPSSISANPFAKPSSETSPASSNPFASSSTSDGNAAVASPSSEPTLASTFASKARLSSPNATPTTTTGPSVPQEPFLIDPKPYPSFHLDAEKEYLDADPTSIPSNARLDPSTDADEGPTTAEENKAAFESSMDKTFQRFADRLAQNPDQVLRYEFGGAPLLYARDDKVGKLLGSGEGSGKVRTAPSADGKFNAPRCGNCGAGRLFECQLTPNAIAELEVNEVGLDGMDWGTVIVGVCGRDCGEKGKTVGEVGYLEEWVGVQWEELEKRK